MVLLEAGNLWAMNRKVGLPDQAALRRDRSTSFSQNENSYSSEGFYDCLVWWHTKPLYRALATQHLPWDKIHVFWGDERYVPPDHQIAIS